MDMKKAKSKSAYSQKMPLAIALLCSACGPGALAPTSGAYGIQMGASGDCMRVNVNQLALSSNLTLDLYVETDEVDEYKVHPIISWPGALALYQSEEDVLTFKSIPTDNADDWGAGATSPTSIFDGQAHHLAVTWNGTRGSIFLDGEIVAYANMDLSGSPDGTLSIGCWEGVAGSFPGVIGEVRFIDGVAWEADFEPPWTPWGVTDEVVGLWHLDEGRGEGLLDETGEFDAVLEGGAWVDFALGEDADE
jgi:hypothetical protein